MNPHRVSWIRRPFQARYRCTAPGCGVTATSVRARQEHADVYEPGLLRAHHLAEPGGEES